MWENRDRVAKEPKPLAGERHGAVAVRDRLRLELEAFVALSRIFALLFFNSEPHTAWRTQSHFDRPLAEERQILRYKIFDAALRAADRVGVDSRPRLRVPYGHRDQPGRR